MSEEKTFSTMLSNVTNAYLPMIERELEGNSVQFGEYARKCVINAVSAISTVLDTAGLNFNSQGVDKSNIASILLNVASLELNASANPSECYFQIRNVKKNDGYIKKIEMGIQGDGYDAILSRFGRNVEKVYPFWEVREDDAFEYPHFDGLQMTPPKWTPGGSGRIVRIVYPILHKDKTIHFYIAERKDVKRNLLAHINNNMMNETFGIAKNRYDATPAQKNEIDKKKEEIKALASTLDLDGILANKELAPFISPSWKEEYSRETMIVRKMRNNITRKIPKDFGSSFSVEKFDELTNDAYVNTKNEIISENASVLIEDITPADEQNAANLPSNEETGANTRPEAGTPNLGDLNARQKPNFD